jgi:hypothetical protein
MLVEAPALCLRASSASRIFLSMKQQPLVRNIDGWLSVHSMKKFDLVSAQRRVKEIRIISDLASGNSVVKYRDWMGVNLVAQQVQASETS